MGEEQPGQLGTGLCHAILGARPAEVMACARTGLSASFANANANAGSALGFCSCHALPQASRLAGDQPHPWHSPPRPRGHQAGGHALGL